MPGMNTLMHIVYCICNELEYSNPDLTEPEQYKTQLEELLNEETIVKKIVFNAALDLVKEEEHKEYLGYIFRGLSASADLLEDTLANVKIHKDPSIPLLQQQALSVVKRLTAFFHARFPCIKAKNRDKSATVKMFKLPVSVSIMATLTKGVVKTNEVPDGMAATVIRFIIRHFSSMNTDKIGYDSFRKHYDHPEPGAIREVIKLLEKIIAYLKEL